MTARPALVRLVSLWPSITPRADARTLKVVVLVVVFAATLVFTYRSCVRARGWLRRLFDGYVTTLDAEARARRRPAGGLRLATTQLALAGALTILFGASGEGWLLALAVAVFVAPAIARRRTIARRRIRLDDQAHPFALALANALKSTSSIGDALRGAVDVTPAPLADELRTALRQVGVGSSLEDALLALSARSDSSSLDVVVSALLVGRQMGGDLPRILESTSTSLRDLKRLEALTDKVTRGAKQSLVISAVVTLGIALMLPHVFPGFLEPMRTTTKGQLWAVQLGAVYLAALYLGYRFTRKSI